MTCPALDLHTVPAAPTLPALRLQAPHAQAAQAVYVMEITTPDGQPAAPTLPGWTLRVWPVARLGDATLEAAGPGSPDSLRLALTASGYGVLGPIRARSA
ncbi:hypothetical protein [Deinococcus ficus]|uniref:Uncharacterized protein n=1 Tax=Deinococcus ficus TaxID=317577 RepID=A0A221SVB8_9DEIO|nr:hypothetical protein [Deinococcus ficus]ASN80595.1 hypothetical protein DFI_05905 [Deinococcus ficus]